MKLPEYSVLMSVYVNDKKEWLHEAIESIIKQTVQPKEIVIVKDGPLQSDLQEVLADWEKRLPGQVKCFSIEKNVGLGAALNFGVQQCACEYIARMDADDIAEPERCEKILCYMMENPDISLAGCGVDEFIGSSDNVVAKVRLPYSVDEVRRFAKVRVPIRHSSILFKKSDVMAVSNYRPLRRSQEYDLVVRMIMAGYKIGNIPDVLQHMRVDNDYYKRRGGLKNAKMLAAQRYDFYTYGFYHYGEFLMYATINIVVCIIPNGFRKLVYAHILRR